MKLRARTGDGDYGLLVAVATAYDMRSARHVRQLLNSHGVRATLGPARIHRWRNLKDHFRILVFPEDAVRAYDVLSRLG
ncbi:hypothetical protein ACFRAQ_01640 [Nocardia sp. NPDC056611]|uniref:hypothetical protein n=1 Tax=unclassified Nocardia TaxID=2637762 RepID=UPI00366B8652